MLIRSDHATALSETNFPEISAIPKLIKMRHISRDALMDQKLHKIEFFSILERPRFVVREKIRQFRAFKFSHHHRRFIVTRRRFSEGRRMQQQFARSKREIPR